MTTMMIKCEMLHIGSKFGLKVEGENRTDWGLFDSEAEALSFLKGWVGGCEHASTHLAELVEKDKQESAKNSAAAVLQATTLRIERDMLRRALTELADRAALVGMGVTPDELAGDVARIRSLLAAQPRTH